MEDVNSHSVAKVRRIFRGQFVWASLQLGFVTHSCLYVRLKLVRTLKSASLTQLSSIISYSFIYSMIFHL